MHNLAVLLSEGVAGEPDLAEAIRWFRAAADHGIKDSQYNLGVMYARGIGTAQDLGESYRWFALAGSQGDADAAARRDDVAKAMSPDALAAARAAVSAWQARAPAPEANGVAAPPGGWEEAAASLDRPELVRRIQTLLAERGFDPGPADGVEGPKTTRAIRAFQDRSGLEVTGRIDPGLADYLAGRPA